MSVLYNTVLSMLFKAYGFEINKKKVFIKGGGCLQSVSKKLKV